MYHLTIHGLVIRDSSYTANPQNPLGSGLRQCCLRGCMPCRYAATKPKARSPMGFLLFRVPWLVKGRRVAVRHGCTLVHRLFCGYLLELSAMLQQARTYTAGCVRGLAGSTPAPLTNQGVTRQGALAYGLHGLNPRNTERDVSANTQSRAMHGARGSGREAKPTNEPSKADVRGAGTCAQFSQLLKSSGFDSALCVSVSKTVTRMQGDQPTHALVGGARK